MKKLGMLLTLLAGLSVFSVGCGPEPAKPAADKGKDKPAAADTKPATGDTKPATGDTKPATGDTKPK